MKRKRKRVCELGDKCPYQNEHQHMSEFTHEGPKKSPVTSE
jgi:hypothetical protein